GCASIASPPRRSPQPPVHDSSIRDSENAGRWLLACVRRYGVKCLQPYSIELSWQLGLGDQVAGCQPPRWYYNDRARTATAGLSPAHYTVRVCHPIRHSIEGICLVFIANHVWSPRQGLRPAASQL